LEDIAFKKILVPAHPTEMGIFTLCVPDDENHDTTLRLQAAAHWLSLYCKITVGFCIYKQVMAETHGCTPARGTNWACTIPQLPGIHRAQRRVPQARRELCHATAIPDLEIWGIRSAPAPKVKHCQFCT